MAFCMYCGAKMSDTAKFCLKCGAPRKRPEELEPVVINAPEGAEVIISDEPPKPANVKETAAKAAAAAKKVTKVITKIHEASDRAGEMILTDWEE